MPKVTKKKKEKDADFKKAKLKLGKGKQQPSNATDTSFKARSIALPGQQNLNRALTSATEPTTAQGLTLDEVILRFRHPNAGVRKETLGGLKDIVSVNPQREVGQVVRALGGLVSDDDAAVRKALIGFTSWYLESVQKSSLVPHLPLLLLQTSSALSHIFPEIRLDACKMVQLLLDQVPDQVVGSWPRASSSIEASTAGKALDGGNNILEGLRLAVGLGGEKGASVQMGKLGNNGRLITLKALTSFVKCALSTDSSDHAESSGLREALSGWTESGSKNAKGKGKMVEISPAGILAEGYLVGLDDWALDFGSDAAWEVGRVEGGDLDNGDNAVSILSHLYLQLSPLLQSTFLESAPIAFGPTSSTSSTANEAPIALCVTAASLTYTLARPILTASIPNNEAVAVRASVADFLRRMAPYFPFRSTPGASPTGMTPSFELNLLYANLAVMLSPNPVSLPKIPPTRGSDAWVGRVKAVESAWQEMRAVNEKSMGQGRNKENTAIWALNEVAEWIVSTLSPNQDALAQTLTSTTYAALLPVIWSLLVQAPPSDKAPSIGKAFFEHIARLSSSSNIKSTGDALIVSLISIHEQRHPRLPFYVPLDSPLRPLIQQWVDSVPKVLWEIGVKDDVATRRLLGFLLEIGGKGREAFKSPHSLLARTNLKSLSDRFATYFHISHPIKGAIPGPWTKLPSNSTKKLALDVARTLTVGQGEDGALNLAVNHAVKGPKCQWAANYWTRA